MKLYFYLKNRAETHVPFWLHYKRSFINIYEFFFQVNFVILFFTGKIKIICGLWMYFSRDVLISLVINKMRSVNILSFLNLFLFLSEQKSLKVQNLKANRQKG